MKKAILLAGAGLMFITNAYAGDKPFVEGKKLFQENCLICHDAQLDPPQAPPMFGVQMKYKMESNSKEEFVNKVTSFVTHPTKDKAVLKMAVNKLGLMPDMGFDKKDVRKIAAYIHDEAFSPPCNHWLAGMKMAKESGDMGHYKKDKKRFDMMCSGKPATKKTSVAAEEGTLKAVMQQLGKDYSALDRAILMGDFSGAEKAAHNIAFHGKPSLGQKMKIMGSLRSEMKDFKKADEKVHNLALEIEKSAKAKDMPLLIKHQSAMLSTCMACHTTFRSRVIDILK